MSPKHRPTGIWLRGTVWQYRTRVPAELRLLLGSTHVNRSLGTSNYSDTIRAARKVAFEIEGMFDAARRGVVSDPDDAGCNGDPPPPPLPAMTADDLLPTTGPAIHIDLDLLAGRIVEKLREDRPDLSPATRTSTDAPVRTKTIQTIQAVYDAYMADPGVIRSGKTILAYELRVRWESAL